MNAHRWNSTLVELLTNAAMLESPASTPGWALNEKSANVTPAFRPVTVSANPVALGATTAFMFESYPHDSQLKPPYTFTPSRDEPTTRFSLYCAPHA